MVPVHAVQQLIDDSINEALADPVKLTLAGLTRVLDLARANGEIPDALYHAVVIPDAGKIVDVSAPDGNGIAEALREYYGQDVRLRVFYGRPCYTTKAPAKYLLTHEGRYPLFDAGTDDEIDPDGSMAKPSSIVVPAAAVPAVAEDGDTQTEIDTEDDDDDDEDDEDDEDG